MKKIVTLKKKLANFAIKAAIAVTICVGVAYFGNYYLMQQTTQLQKIDGEINQKRSEIATIEDNVNIYEKHFKLFQELSEKITSGKYELDIDRSGKVLELLGRKHRITNLNVDITTKQNLGSIEYVSFKPIFREVKLTFSAMSDAHIYAFLANIEQYFSGYLQCSKIAITRKRILDGSALEEVRKGATTELLDAELGFLWLGIEEKTPEKSKI